MILMAVAELDRGEGLPVNAVSKMLHVDSSFVTTQSKLLEKKGLMRRRATTRAWQHLRAESRRPA
jgi:MarR family transcriptional regulator, organic hydroperoxide resistance regulator